MNRHNKINSVYSLPVVQGTNEMYTRGSKRTEEKNRPVCSYYIEIAFFDSVHNEWWQKYSFLLRNLISDLLVFVRPSPDLTININVMKANFMIFVKHGHTTVFLLVLIRLEFVTVSTNMAILRNFEIGAAFSWTEVPKFVWGYRYLKIVLLLLRCTVRKIKNNDMQATRTIVTC